MFRLIISQNTGLVFSPNNYYMAVSGKGSLVRIWEANTWTELSCLSHEYEIYSLAFSPDSQYLITASQDKTSIWQAPHFREVSRITYNEYIRQAVFSPCGRYLALANSSGAVSIWLWRPEDLINEACHRLPRKLTHEEWEQFLGDEPFRQTCPEGSDT